MKKTFLLLLLFALFAHTLQAQIGFEAGLNMANLAIKSNGTKVATKYKAGAALGLFADIKLGDGGHMYFEPAAYYQNNGATIKGNPDYKYLINSADFPLSIEYKSGDKCSQRFFAGIGPYIGDNIIGSYSIAYIGTVVQNYDFGIGLNAGFIGKKHLYIRARYLIGLDNEYPSGDSKNSIKQSSGGLTIGYMIRGCRSRSVFGGSHRHEGNHWRGLKKNHWSTRQRFRTPPGPGI